jgi:hypothetical protein
MLCCVMLCVIPCVKYHEDIITVEYKKSLHTGEKQIVQQMHMYNVHSSLHTH